MNPTRRPVKRARPLGRKVTRCGICGEPVRQLTQHLIEKHNVPLVRIGAKK